MQTEKPLFPIPINHRRQRGDGNGNICCPEREIALFPRSFAHFIPLSRLCRICKATLRYLRCKPLNVIPETALIADMRSLWSSDLFLVGLSVSGGTIRDYFPGDGINRNALSFLCLWRTKFQLFQIIFFSEVFKLIKKLPSLLEKKFVSNKYWKKFLEGLENFFVCSEKVSGRFRKYFLKI